MNSLPYHKRYHRDFLEGTAGMTLEVKGAYSILLDVIYQDLMERVRTPEALDRIFTRVRTVARTVGMRWREPDCG